MQTTVDAMDAYGKRQTAVHEAGHVVAYFRLAGIAPTAEIERDLTGDAMTARTWRGKTTCLVAIDSWPYAIVGIAGGVAEAMDTGKQGFIRSDLETSQADRRMIAKAFGETDLSLSQFRRINKSRHAATYGKLLQEAIELLEGNWQLVDSIAKHLIETHSFTEWDMFRLTNPSLT